MHKLGDAVSWVVVGQLKLGVVVQVVPAGWLPDPELYDRSTAVRDHESYVIRVTHRKSGVYWPKVCMLCRTNTEVARASARRVNRRICAHEFHGFYCTLPERHEGKHAALSGGYPLQLWENDNARV